MKIAVFTENTNRNKKARELLLKGFCDHYPENGGLKKGWLQRTGVGQYLKY
jgi:hypothetical protein